MPGEHILLVTSDTQLGQLLEHSVLRPEGYDVIFTTDSQMAIDLPKRSMVDLILLGEEVSGRAGVELAKQLSELYPAVPIVLMTRSKVENLSMGLFGIWENLVLPVVKLDVLDALNRILDRSRKIKQVYFGGNTRSIQVLQRRLEATEALQLVGRSVASLLNLDEILTTVVDAAVDMTGAEEGTLLLLDEASGELYMRAARNFQDEFVRRFRLPIRDSLAGQVMRTGKPLAINTREPQKIKTAYLVHTLIYAPLTVTNRVIGVLGVDNRQSGHPFHEEHLSLITALADYAAIAIENARSYSALNLERKKLEIVLTKVEDGVIVIDHDDRIILANHTVCDIFNLVQGEFTGKLFSDLFTHPDLLEIYETNKPHSYRAELTLDDGRVFNTQVTPIAEVGKVITMQDITYLKELDRIKSDFVATVSHDLRSPLTAILGYIELIERAGPVNQNQREFIRRVQFSVNNITSLINDLLDLGRIEAGFDARKEFIPLVATIKLAVDRVEDELKAKKIELKQEFEENLPAILANSSRICQLVTNLLSNAIKFSTPGAEIAIRVALEANQILLQIKDQGLGIPLADQPYIFDKFYRASNVPANTVGTGLGLAIVKSIVENHGGRIWVDSLPDQGSTFTVVLPIADSVI
jgi:two-component system NtrC family sensor kinase